MRKPRLRSHLPGPAVGLGFRPTGGKPVAFSHAQAVPIVPCVAPARAVRVAPCVAPHALPRLYLSASSQPRCWFGQAGRDPCQRPLLGLLAQSSPHPGAFRAPAWRPRRPMLRSVGTTLELAPPFLACSVYLSRGNSQSGSRGRSRLTRPVSKGGPLEESRTPRTRDKLDLPEDLDSKENCKVGDLFCLLGSG